MAALWLLCLSFFLLSTTKWSSNSNLLAHAWSWNCESRTTTSRRSWFQQIATITGTVVAPVTVAVDPGIAEEGGMNVDSYLKSGMVSMPMGVSGQASGKGRPETGIILKEGTKVSRDEQSGKVLAEIMLSSSQGNDKAILTSFSSPWPLAKGSLFDVECRDARTGDGVFLTVAPTTTFTSTSQLNNAFILSHLFSPTGRFSFYGTPTDVKITSRVDDESLSIVDVNFSTLSQATMSEIPRKARIAMTIPRGTNQPIMLVSSASANRWKKGSNQAVAATINSFRVIVEE